MNTRLLLVLKILSVIGMLCLGGTIIVYAQTGVEMGDTVAITAEVLDNLNADPDMTWFRSNLKRAHGVLLMRQYRARFIVGVSGGRGCMLARDTKTDK